MARKHNPEWHKKKLLKALEFHKGIVSHACKDVGLSKTTFYDYCKKDPEFKNKVDEIDEITLDFVESKLLDKIDEGSERSILFYMKYKGRKRGYTDSLDITTGGDKITEIKLIQIKNKDNDDIGD
jgi:hypothetical protein